MAWVVSIGKTPKPVMGAGFAQVSFETPVTELMVSVAVPRATSFQPPTRTR